jgi:phosphoenolpyruvate carboxykinase (GTP)
MLPFCGYNMADYFAHWLKLGEREDVRLPRVFHVNWFRKDEDGKFLWPGYGENSRVLAWIFRRCDDAAEARHTPIGLVPAAGSLEIGGLDPERVEAALHVDLDEARAELDQIKAHLAKFGGDLPDPVHEQFESLKRRLA